MTHILQIVATLASLALCLAALPVVLELGVLSLAALFPPRQASATRVDKEPALTVLIPAHNEEQLIAACVGSLMASRAAAPVRIAVIAHNCTDRTAQQAQAAGAEVLELNDAIGGKGTALDFGFRNALAAGADAALVIDADSLVSANLIPAVLGRLARGADALQCRYEVANAEATPRTRLAALAFLGMNVLRPRGRDRLGLSCGIFGNGFALSAATLRRVPYGANSLVEDLEYHLLLIRAGLRVQFVDEAAVYGEMPNTSAASATQRARWEGGRLLMRRQWTAPLLALVLRGRLRLLEPLLDLRAVPLATGAAFLLVALLLALLGRSSLAELLSAAGLLTFLLYVVVAASLSRSPARTLAALARVPAYMAWKLVMLPRTRLAARKDAGWIRTARNQPGGEPAENHLTGDGKTR